MCAFVCPPFHSPDCYFFWCYVSFLWKTTKMNISAAESQDTHRHQWVLLLATCPDVCCWDSENCFVFSLVERGSFSFWGEFWVRGFSLKLLFCHPLKNLWTRPENTPNGSQLTKSWPLGTLRKLSWGNLRPQKSEPQKNPFPGVVWILGYDGCHWKCLSRDPWRWPDVVEICTSARFPVEQRWCVYL